MGWIEDQIKQRKEADNQQFSDSFLHLANSISGKKIFANAFEVIKDSLNNILRYYHCKTDYKIPDSINTFAGELDFACGYAGLVYREVKLTPGWYKDATGAFLAFYKEDHTPVALIPCFAGYKFYFNGKYVRVNKKNQSLFDTEALCFYKSLPNRDLKIIDLVKFAFSSVHPRSFIFMGLMMLVTTLVGLLTPKITYFLYGPLLEYNSVTLLLTSIGFMLSISISMILFRTFQSMYTSIISTNIGIAVNSAVVLRVFSLQPGFFRQYSAGELSSRAGYISSLTTSLVDLLFNTTLSSLLSLAYISSIFTFAPTLVIPSIIIILVTILFSLFSAFAQMRISKKKMEIDAKESGLSYSIVNGISKIRLAGAEKRLFAKWADVYAESAKYVYSPPTYIKYNSAITLIISLLGTIIMYYFAIKAKVSVASYSAFTSAYGMVFSAFSSLASIALVVARIKPTYELAKPILKAKPEKRENKEIVTKLSGSIDISNVSFRYNESMPLVLDNLSIKIKPGQYVAIVGKTGCGKSTLVRLLLGFETPQKGSVYYDGKDVNSLNLKSLRRKIGTVMQDGKLFQGDIFSNIAVCAPELTVDGAFEAADIAGIGDDIRNMPMGMNTMVSDGGGGISGGQKQRILIARAIAPRPSILIFDEATSALDNITQRKVSEALDKLKCTRIVIAHRLFTIQQCDRIIYLENGKIKEDGTYQELMDQNGAFADLVHHQLLESKD